MEVSHKRLICLIMINIFLIHSTTVVGLTISKSSSDILDFDLLVDVSLTVEIQKIRSFDKYDQHLLRREYIDKDSNPDFYIKIKINDQEFISDIWHDAKYIYDPQFSASYNVPDDQEIVNVEIQLWDWNEDGDILCDIGDKKQYVELSYNIKTGHWTGDDKIGDSSGYGRLNGCDDGSIYRRDRDCELWFDIYQNDFDGDGIPYWTEVNIYGTDPNVEDIGDPDEDGIPIEWEWKWEYDPFKYDDHTKIDPEKDGINNIEEYLTSQWGSDPFRKDLFIELDQMEESPQGEKSLLPEESKEILYTAYDRQNLVYHLDDGIWNNTGSELIPFNERLNYSEVTDIYNNYFLHNDEDNWRRGVFHYGLVIHSSSEVAGMAFGPNRFYITSKGHEKKSSEPLLDRDTVYASAYMHETGHTLGFWPVPGHNRRSMYPRQLGWWINRPYKSCMNYGYMYYTVDYSNGAWGLRDLNDWKRMSLTYFQMSWN